jgi:hypothetical protein
MNAKAGLRLVSLVWAARLTLAWVASRPLAVLLGGGVMDDRMLFEPGALGLLEVLRLRFELLGPATRATFGLLALGYVLLAFFDAWLTRTLLTAESPSPAKSQHAPLIELAPRLVGLWLLLMGPALVLAVLAGAGLGGLVEGPLSRGSSLAQSSVLALGVLLILSIVAAFGVVHDVARTQLLDVGDGVKPATMRGFRVVRRNFRPIVGLRAAFAVGALAVTSAATALTGIIAVDRPGDLRPWAAFANHQVAAWLLAALHVAWLLTTVRFKAHAQP